MKWAYHQPHPSPEQLAILELYKHLLEAWNAGSAAGMAALLEEEGNMIGFDGSQLDGRSRVEESLSAIFSQHPISPFVSIIREIRMTGPGSGLLRATAGMIPAGQTTVNPAVNAIQTLVAVKRQDRWQIALFQNTPAAFHGEPERVEKLTRELNELAAG